MLLKTELSNEMSPEPDRKAKRGYQVKQLAKINLCAALHLGLLLYTLLIFLSVKSLPLLSTFGLESANLLVLLLGPAFFIVAALRNRDISFGYRHILSQELVWLSFHLAFICSLLLINGFFVASCSQGAGFLPFLVVMLPPILLNISLGALLAKTIEKRSLKLWIAILAYGLYFLYLGWLFLKAPSFRLCSHLSVLITSDLINGADLNGAVIGFRTSTLLLALAVITLGLVFFSGRKHVIRSSLLSRSSACVLILFLLVGYQIIHKKSLMAIGKDRDELINDYQELASDGGLMIWADPQKTSLEQAQRMLDEARFYRAQLKQQLGDISHRPITIWLHHSNREKFLYTGAKNVHFALPKKREIHISGYGIPHPVLGHELAHIYVGEYSHTILGLPGPNYFIPNMALTEGIVMLLTKELNVDNDLSMQEQARALYQSGIKPDLKKLFANNPLQFASLHPRSSYIYAGAALEFFIHGIAPEKKTTALIRLIERGELIALFDNQEDMTLKIGSFIKSLSQPIAPYQIYWAKRVFKPKSILTSDCSHRQINNDLVERALLNGDLHALTQAITPLSTEEQYALLEQAIRQGLANRKYIFSLVMAEQLLSLLKNEITVFSQEVELLRLKALVNLDRLQEADMLAQKIHHEILSPAQQRLLLCARTFLMELKTTSVPRLYRAVLGYLFSGDDINTKLAAMAYQLGEETTLSNAQEQAVLMAKYLYARFHQNLRSRREAFLILDDLMGRLYLMPQSLVREIRLMYAEVSDDLGYASEARLVYLMAEGSALTQGVRQIIADRLARINFSKEYTQ